MSESVTESGRCDFCQIRESKHTINGGLWWICDICMDIEINLTPHRGEEECVHPPFKYDADGNQYVEEEE